MLIFILNDALENYTKHLPYKFDYQFYLVDLSLNHLHDNDTDKKSYQMLGLQ